MDDSVQEAARCIRRAGGSIVGDSLTSFTAPEQILLPWHLGGCGFPSITPSVARAARLSSAYLTQLALQNAPTHLCPVDGPHLPALDQMWDAVKSCAPGLCAPHKSLVEARKDYTLSHLQTTVARHKAQQLFDELISKVNLRPPEARMQTLARLRSIGCRSASA
jgi:hypothetical protein